MNRSALKIVVCIAMLLAPVTLARAGSFSLPLSRASADAGGHAELEVSLATSNENLTALAFVVEYDAQRLAFDGVVDASGGTTGTISPMPGGFQSSLVLQPAGHIGIAIYHPDLPLAAMTPGRIATLRFDVSPNADGFAFVRISSVSPPDATDLDGNSLSASFDPAGSSSGVAITAARPQLTVSPTALQFGTVRSGTANARTIVVANSGTAPLTITDIALVAPDPNFSIASKPVLPLTLAPGASAAIVVQFSSQSLGAFDAMLRIASPDSGTPQIFVPLSATATEEGTFAFDSRMLVAAVAHANGLAGSLWRSGLVLRNSGSVSAAARITFLDAAGNSPAITTVQIDPGATVSWDDTVKDLFGRESVGALVVEASSPDVIVRSATMNVNGAQGTYGQSVPVVAWRNLFRTGETADLVGLERSSARRTSVALFNASDTPAVLHVRLLDSGGHEIGSRDYALNPLQLAQGIDIFNLVTADAKDLAIEVTAKTDNATYFAYASTVDNRSGAPVFQSRR